jgi:hypothetical protein
MDKEILDGMRSDEGDFRQSALASLENEPKLKSS